MPASEPNRYNTIELMVNYARAVGSWASLLLRKPNNPLRSKTLWIVYHDRHLSKLEKLRNEKLK